MPNPGTPELWLWEDGEPMVAHQFSAALMALGWSEEQAAAQFGAAEVLGAAFASPDLVRAWCQGTQAVPVRVARFVRVVLMLREWNQGRGDGRREGVLRFSVVAIATLFAGAAVN